MSIKLRLIVMNFLQFGVWGAYLTSMGSYLAASGLASYIGMFYAMQGVVSLFMPAIVGIIADRWVPAQRLLGVCHLLAATFMGSAGYYALQMGEGGTVWPLFALYTLSVAFYMPTIALSNSVAYSILESRGEDTVAAFPPIRVWGTVGFIFSMLACDFLGYQHSALQFIQSAVLGAILGLYCFSLPECPTAESHGRRGLAEALGVKAFALFKQRRMALFFIFSMLLGVSLQITNGFANPFISAFKDIPEYASTFGANHANALISLSQISETLCILLIPFFLKRFGIKYVMLIAMLAWVLRFALFGLGNPGGGVWMFILSMIVYGIAFDFFNISGSLYVNEQTDDSIRSSAQGLFMIMTNGVGATIGTLMAQAVVNRFVYTQTDGLQQIAGWQTSWLIFAAYSLVVAILFAILFKRGYAQK
ncbi:MAG: MFS transporter [Alistipes sp.]|nr:MFS transporter [Alistipes sp.]MBQ6988863.1 MFS transporter [Alistipes sp.]MBQ7964194.1 MFS transporter [Alistipes sp.]